MKSLSHVKAAVLEGGGIFGLAYLPIFDRWRAAGFRPSVVAGASAGALTGLVLASGAPGAKVLAELERDDLEKVFGGYWSPVEIVRRGGLHGLGNVRRWLRDFSWEVLGVGLDGATLRSFAADVGVALRVAVTVEGYGVVYLDERSEVPLEDALIASMAVPGYYGAVPIPRQLLGLGKGTAWCSDGGLVANLPLAAASEFPADRILAARVTAEPSVASDLVEDYRPSLWRRIGWTFGFVRHEASKRHVDDKAFENSLVEVFVPRSWSFTDWGLLRKHKAATFERLADLAVANAEKRGIL